MSECWMLLLVAGLRKEAAELYAGDQGAEAGIEYLRGGEWRSAHQGI